MQTIALIVAGGRGTRIARRQDGIPKQYITLERQTVLQHTFDVFNDHEEIDKICVVIHPDDVTLYQNSLNHNQGKLTSPVFGGATRQMSVYNGLQSLTDMGPYKVLIHDAARPFISAQLISNLIKALDAHKAVLPGLAVKDTLKRAKPTTNATFIIEETISRENLWQAQTPQCFHYDDILKAHEAASLSEHTFTDDASVAEWYGLETTLIPGEDTNFKITTSEDLTRAKNYLQQTRTDKNMQTLTLTGSGFDVHRFTDGDHVILCGVKIPYSQSLQGHSDADVGLHALTDAILGAIADGDIGTHFPPSDPQWKGVSSDVFLKDAVKKLHERGGSLQNIDVTLICEYPKIGPHREAMRASLSELLNLDIRRVSVKATTTEGLGFTGRKEGIAAMASVSISLPVDN